MISHKYHFYNIQNDKRRCTQQGLTPQRPNVGRHTATKAPTHAAVRMHEVRRLAGTVGRRHNFGADRTGTGIASAPRSGP